MRLDEEKSYWADKIRYDYFGFKGSSIIMFKRELTDCIGGKLI
jgi:hypothetical protein